MIAHVAGKIIKKTLQYFIIDVNGIGYKVSVLPQLLNLYQEGKTINVFTHQYVREDQIALYGFADFEELKMFETLISISGIGPKAALNVLASASPEEVTQAVYKNDLSLFTRVPGIGKKSASKILLELSGKLNIDHDITKTLLTPEDQYAVSALKKLGFKDAEALQAIQQAGIKYPKLEDKIRAGLQYLNKL